MKKLIDKTIAEKIAADNQVSLSKLGLRFDRVVVGLLSSLRDAVSTHIPEGTAVIVTLTAPIWVPSKTEAEIRARIMALLQHQSSTRNQKADVFQNKVCLRKIKVPATQSIRLLGFVHNPGTDPELLLNLATAWLNSERK